MKSSPILFKAPMVRALLAGSKVQTRRPVNRVRGLGAVTEFQRSDTRGYDWTMRDPRLCWNDLRHDDLLARCPYGGPGDQLWVKETFRIAGGREFKLAGYDTSHAQYRADRDDGHIDKYESPLHMTRELSRITLTLASVRVEQVQAISEADALAEGINRIRIGDGYDDRYSGTACTWADAIEQHPDVQLTAADAFRELWVSINGPGSWIANPWVWVLEFQRVRP